jgi:hypothetical protein
MITLSFGIGFKNVLPELRYEVKAQNVAELYNWAWENLPSLHSVLFDIPTHTIKPFVCIMRNQMQIDCNNLSLPLHSGDKIEILLPMSGG